MKNPIKREYTEKMLLDAYYTWYNDIHTIIDVRIKEGVRYQFTQWKFVAKELVEIYGRDRIDRNAEKKFLTRQTTQMRRNYD